MTVQSNRTDWRAYGMSRFRFVQHCITLVLASFLFCIGCYETVAEEAIEKASHVKNFTETLQHEGIERTYHIHLPPDFNKDMPAPLVFALHGGGGEGRRFDQSTTQGTLTAAADKRGVILIFPEGINKHWCDGRTEILKTKKVYDDVGFISKIIDTMVKNYGVDPTRVYATGISNGGFMSVRLAIDLSGKIAAVAPVAAQISKALKEKTPKLPISIMIVNGTKDPLVPFEGGHIRLFKFGRSRGEILSTASTVEHFRRYNGCSITPEKSKLQDKDPDDGTNVEIEKYAGGKDKTEVILVKIIGGGHTWPGGSQYLTPRVIGPVCRDINASEIILDFFLAHSRMERYVK
jgi:polyhydroxybutyrate depolymerase